MDIITKRKREERQREIIDIVDEELLAFDGEDPSKAFNRIMNKMLKNSLYTHDNELFAKRYFGEKLLADKDFHHQKAL